MSSPPRRNFRNLTGARTLIELFDVRVELPPQCFAPPQDRSAPIFLPIVAHFQPSLARCQLFRPWNPTTCSYQTLRTQLRRLQGRPVSVQSSQADLGIWS